MMAWPFRWMCWIGAWIAWLLAVGGLTYWFVYASNTVALLCACGVAGLLYVLRRHARLPYGLLECLAGGLLLAQAIYLLWRRPWTLQLCNPTPACS